MKNKIVISIALISVVINFYILGKWLFWDFWYEPTKEEQIILNQMAQLTVESEDYRRIAKDHNIIAIAPKIDKNKGGVFPFNMEIEVKTDKMTYILTCDDSTCSDMSYKGEYFTTYTDEDLLLPFKQ